MKQKVSVAPLGLAVCLSGCASPELTYWNERGGILSNANGTNEAAAYKVADYHCRMYGRVAQITKTDIVYNKINFACVEP